MVRPIIVVDNWKFENFFAPQYLTKELENNRAIIQGRQLLASALIGDHPFFSVARSSRAAIQEWAKQECVITNFFSQVLFDLMSTIENVHLRSVLAPVVTGEHSELRDGIAYGPHPHLLSKLVIDIEVDPSAIRPLPFTVRFADALSKSTSSLLYGLGFLGLGNEAMLVPEYSAVEIAFEAHYPREIYRPFLRANIEEDKTHSSLMEIAAICSFKSEKDEDEYVRGARDGVQARVKYYDELLLHVRSLIG